MKKYKLLKDYSTPDLIAKAGEVGEQKPSDIYDENCKVWFDNGRYFFYLSQVKMHPSWFQELVTEPSIVPERIEVIKMGDGENSKNKDWPQGYYMQIVTTGYIWNDKFPAIKQAIESALNEPLPSPPVLNDTVVEGEMDLKMYERVLKWDNTGTIQRDTVNQTDTNVTTNNDDVVVFSVNDIRDYLSTVKLYSPVKSYIRELREKAKQKLNTNTP